MSEVNQVSAVDAFNGDNQHLISCIEALLSLDAKGALVPHGVGEHARTLLAAAVQRLATAEAGIKWEADRNALLLAELESSEALDRAEVGLPRPIRFADLQIKQADFDRVTAERDALQHLLNRRDEQVESLKATPRGEPFAWYTEDYLSDKSATTYDMATMERWKSKGWPVTPLYAEQPAPVATGFKVADFAGFNIIEDPTMQADSLRLCNCNQGRLPCTCKPSAYDGFDNSSD